MPSTMQDVLPVGFEDMIQMDNLTEQTLLDNIELRYNHDLIYVRILFKRFENTLTKIMIRPMLGIF